jgi:hypothetical protein
MSQELHEHQGLVDVAHPHPLGDEPPQALEGGGGGLGARGGMAASAGHQASFLGDGTGVALEVEMPRGSLEAMGPEVW